MRKKTAGTTSARSDRDTPTVLDALHAKAAHLHSILSGFESAIVAFSGGADSAFLAHTASTVLGQRALAVTADSASYPEAHRQLAHRVASEFRIPHETIRTAEIDRPEYRANPANRCYYCKQELYAHLTAMAASRGFAVVLDGSNADDRGDYRPGRQAAREYGVKSPLDEADLTKDDIRWLSREAGLPTWDVPASACLSSRIPYGREVTVEKLRTIERAEDILRGLGFRIFRVRHYDDLARIELARAEMPHAAEPAVAEAIVREFRALGYAHVTLDLAGYRLGSLNDALRLRPVS